MTGETLRLSRFLADRAADGLPDKLRRPVTRMVIDTAGVSMAATSTATYRRAKEQVGGPPTAGPTARVLGEGFVCRPTDAAFLNGLLAHALDFDDIHARMGGHPTAPVFPAALAAAEHRHASGSRLLTAIGLGAEVETILGDIMNPGHATRGWHPTAVLGRIGAAVAAGVVYEFDADEFATVIGLAASGASGLRGNFGTMTKPYHVGSAARGGLEAAQLVANGFTASQNILEADVGGFCAMFEGAPPSDFGTRLAHLGDPWGLLNPPPGMKPYPCCGSTQSPIDAARSIHETHGLELADIERVEIFEHPNRIPHTDRQFPKSSHAAKFSVQYVVTVALDQGDVGLEDFTDEAVGDPARQRFLERVTVTADESVAARLDDVPGAKRADWSQWDARFTDRLPRNKQAFLRVTTKDGDRHEAFVDSPRGMPPNPLSAEEIYEKYRRCAARQLPTAQVERSLATLVDLENIADVSLIVDELSPIAPEDR